MAVFHVFETYLAILERPCMQRHSTVSKECLDLRHEQVALFKKISQLELVTLKLATLGPAQNQEKSAYSNITKFGVNPPEHHPED